MNKSYNKNPWISYIIYLSIIILGNKFITSNIFLK
jgi:hypothetical protein